jgi:hypothetical protein
VLCEREEGIHVLPRSSLVGEITEYRYSTFGVNGDCIDTCAPYTDRRNDSGDARGALGDFLKCFLRQTDRNREPRWKIKG